MKKAKKIAALVLAMVMAFSLMAMPAMAAGDDGIMPRKPAYTCSLCGRGATYIGVEYEYHYDASRPVSPGQCSAIPVEHLHVPYDIKEVYQCGNCGQKYLFKTGASYECVRYVEQNR